MGGIPWQADLQRELSPSLVILGDGVAEPKAERHCFQYQLGLLPEEKNGAKRSLTRFTQATGKRV
jgi:hypothetical protein